MFPLKQKSKGFTLIELLVVISIISLLSSIVITSLSSAKARARVAAGLAFHDSLNALRADGALLVAMNEGSGSPKDESDNNLTGNIIGGVTWSTNSPYNNGSSLLFNGSSYVHFPNKIDGAMTNKVTISAWIYPLSLPAGYQGIAGSTSNGGFMMFTHGTNLSCKFTTDTGATFLYTGTLETNKWQQVACIYDGSNIRGMVNGSEVGRLSKTGTIVQVTHALIGLGYIGSSEYFNGYIDDVKIFSAIPQ